MPQRTPLPLRAIDALSSALGFVSGMCIVGAALLILAEIFSRDVLGQSLLVSDEYTGYLMAATSFLGLAHVEKDHGHIRMDLISKLRTSRPRLYRALLLACYVVGVAFSLYLLRTSWMTLEQSVRYASRSMQYSQTLLAIPQSVLPVGAAALCLQYICNACKVLRAAPGERIS